MSVAGKIGDLDAGRYIDNLGGIARISLSLGIICNTGIDIDPHNAEEAGIAELVVVVLSDVPLSPCVAGEGTVVAGDIVPGIKGDLLVGGVADKFLGYTSLERSTVLSRGLIAALKGGGGVGIRSDEGGLVEIKLSAVGCGMPAGLNILKVGHVTAEKRRNPDINLAVFADKERSLGDGNILSCGGKLGPGIPLCGIGRNRLMQLVVVPGQKVVCRRSAGTWDLSDRYLRHPDSGDS